MGATPARNAVLTAYARILIRRKARQLCRRPGFSHSDQEDLVQELTLRLLQKANCYDPMRGASLDTFADRVITSSVKMILRDRRRHKRAAGFTALSLESTTVLRGGQPIVLSDTVSMTDRQRITLESPGELDERDRALLAEIVASLPADLRDVVERLLAGGSIASVARDLDESRRQIYAALHRAKSYFQHAGFDRD